MDKKPSPNYYAATVVINTDGKVLLGKRTEDGIWTTPAGGAEPGEQNPSRTAVRELFEEAGIPADERFLQPLEQVECRNGKTCFTFLYVVSNGQETTSKLDPDQEVKTWKWFSMAELPPALIKDERRHASVRAGFMKYYDVKKSLIETLEKGKPAAVGEIRNFGGKEYQKMGNGEWKAVVHQEEKQLQAEQKNKVVSLTSKLKEKLADKTQISHSEKHLNDLTNQAIVDGATTRSEKPVFTKVDDAMAHGYEAADFREVGNFFYDRAEKMAANIEKLKATGQEVDPQLEKIKALNLRYSKSFISQANRVDDRKKMAKSESVVNWLDQVEKLMSSYSYGEEPRSISLNSGSLYLVQVDQGMYSGVYKSATTDEPVNVKLERMELPSLVQFCIAKGWMSAPDQQPGLSYAAQMDYYGGQLDAADRGDKTVDTLIEKLDAPKAPQPSPIMTSNQEAKMAILRIIEKLVN